MRSGLLIIAGSNFNLVRIMGSIAPIIFATIITLRVESPRVRASGIPSLNIKLLRKKMLPIDIPRRRPVSSSFFITENHFRKVRSPVDIARITRVADCVDVLPPVSIRTGIKKARAITDSRVTLKRATIVEDINPVTRSIESHITLFV